MFSGVKNVLGGKFDFFMFSGVNVLGGKKSSITSLGRTPLST